MKLINTKLLVVFGLLFSFTVLSPICRANPVIPPAPSAPDAADDDDSLPKPDWRFGYSYQDVVDLLGKPRDMGQCAVIPREKGAQPVSGITMIYVFPDPDRTHGVITSFCLVRGTVVSEQVILTESSKPGEEERTVMQAVDYNILKKVLARPVKEDPYIPIDPTQKQVDI